MLILNLNFYVVLHPQLSATCQVCHFPLVENNGNSVLWGSFQIDYLTSHHRQL